MSRRKAMKKTAAVGKKKGGRLGKRADRRAVSGGARKRTTANRGLPDPETVFPRLAGEPVGRGMGVFLAVATHDGAYLRLRMARFEDLHGPANRRRRRPSPCTADPVALARLLHGLAHPDRIRVLDVLCLGAETHQELKCAVNLQAGPLYHHLRELERAGLVESPARNQYVPTTAGVQTWSVAAGLAVVNSDDRPGAPWRRRLRRIRLQRG